MKPLIQKLILGTAQFGFDYGISNQRGKIPEQECGHILYEAWENGLNALDTAYGYGSSEITIGRYLQKYPEHAFRIFTKLPYCTVNETGKSLWKSLDRLGQDHIYGCYIHQFQDFVAFPEIWKQIRTLQAEGLIDKIGFSLYYPSELEYLLKSNIYPNMVQIPYNILDQRFKPYFSEMATQRIEVHARSVFLQGILLKDPLKLKSTHWAKLIPKLQLFHEYAQIIQLPIPAICLGFCLLEPSLDQILFGVDNLAHFRDNLEMLTWIESSREIFTRFPDCSETDEQLILPCNWS